MMAIAQGVFYASMFEAFTEQMTREAMDKAYNIQVGGMILFMPALFLISFYEYFPRWLRWMSILVNIPYFICNGLFMSGYRNYAIIDLFAGIGGLGLGTTQILWGVWVWKRRYEH